MQILSSIFETICKTLKDSPALIAITIIVMVVTSWSFDMMQGQLNKQNQVLLDLIENQTRIIDRMEDEADDTKEFISYQKSNNDLLIEIKSRLK